MRATDLGDLATRLRGRVLLDEPLAPHTTYRIGGPAAALVLPESVDDVVSALTFAARTGRRWLALGLGSNVLIADAGFDGVVIRLGKGLDHVVAGAGGDATRWSVGAGLPTPRLARRTARAGLGGVHRLIGIPGSVGGGVFMNAGAHGQDFSQVVRSVTVVGGDGTVREVAGVEIPWRYRSSGLAGRIVLESVVQLAPADPRRLEREIRQHLRWRKAGTPFREPCCGSVFRNPGAGGAGAAAEVNGSPRAAGQLIEAAGLKGYRVGAAAVSRKHANYVVNLGGATASDVLAVIGHVRERVHGEYGVELELEVQVIE